MRYNPFKAFAFYAEEYPFVMSIRPQSPFHVLYHMLLLYEGTRCLYLKEAPISMAHDMGIEDPKQQSRILSLFANDFLLGAYEKYILKQLRLWKIPTPEKSSKKSSRHKIFSRRETILECVIRMAAQHGQTSHEKEKEKRLTLQARKIAEEDLTSELNTKVVKKDPGAVMRPSKTYDFDALWYEKEMMKRLDELTQARYREIAEKDPTIAIWECLNVKEIFRGSFVGFRWFDEKKPSLRACYSRAIIGQYWRATREMAFDSCLEERYGNLATTADQHRFAQDILQSAKHPDASEESCIIMMRCALAKLKIHGLAQDKASQLSESKVRAIWGEIAHHPPQKAQPSPAPSSGAVIIPLHLLRIHGHGAAKAIA